MLYTVGLPGTLMGVARREVKFTLSDGMWANGSAVGLFGCTDRSRNAFFDLGLLISAV